MEVKDMQGLLAQKFGENVKLIRHSTSKFLATNENFCSTVVKLEATVRKSEENQSEKTIYLVAKLLEDDEF